MMNFDSNLENNMLEYLTTKDVGTNNSSKSVSGNGSVDQLRLLLDSKFFHEIAQNILKNIKDKEILVECAELIGEKERGGLYYKAKLWAKVFRLSQNRKSNYDLELTNLFKKVGIKAITAKKLAELGEKIVSFEKKNKKNKFLRNAPNKVFEKAKQKKINSIEYFKIANTVLAKRPDATANLVHRQWCKEKGGVKANLDIIKPSDWWAFSHPKWRKETDFDGSIPGEIYANSLYYFAPQKGIAVDAMAGSGMLKRVYDDRKKWQKDSDFRLKIYLYDIEPQRKFIIKHDSCKPLPVRADWIFLDPPYFGQSEHLFNGVLSKTKDYDVYLETLSKILAAMAESLNAKGRLCVFLPKWSGLDKRNPNYNIPKDVCDIVENLHLTWIDTAFVSRGRQQEAGSAMKNISAKRNRRMRSDTCVLNVFEKMEKN